ncbi:RdgB/HAM1 family non-canonical purine NTP pyrophosphatase [Aquirufa sp. HETE-83D]|uniref:dITP/XTP pyrophosphatase n=1 Tax=Aquirufa esocilacus TaxID=3096513 RepID=A0ABW6DMJ9_9BACT
MLPILYLATQNKHKVEELRALLENHFTVRDLSSLALTEEIPETGATLTENSLQKARYIAEKFQVSCLADDSGLEVEALGGEPGVYSARYAGEPKDDQANLQLLLHNLQGNTNRNARFVTVLTYFDHSSYYSFEGEIQGTIVKSPRGTQGFGYDPVFQPEMESRTFAEMTLAEKNKIAHRARALEKFKNFLDETQKCADV